MRGLSLKQAAACENAITPRCRCRCGGKFHGAGRAGPHDPPEAYTALGEDDPHYVEPEPGVTQGSLELGHSPGAEKAVARAMKAGAVPRDPGGAVSEGGALGKRKRRLGRAGRKLIKGDA